MKPLKLKFNGVNSFSSTAVIDFEKLTTGGLFGIFGDTGSGKSTILDSINFALYGDVDRSKKKTDIINYNCEQAEVEFSFNILINGKREVYRVERSIKKKNGLGKAMLYVKDGDGERCIADNTTSVNAKIENILGLSAEDFRKCIALPQGEFAQFVKSSPAERFKLIERLFSLGRFGDGLRDKINAAESAADSDLNAVKAQYDVLSEVTEELIGSLSESCSRLSEQLIALEKESEAADKLADKLKAAYEVIAELASVEKKLSESQARSAEMEKLRSVIKSAPSCRHICELDAKRNRLTDARTQEDKRRSALESQLKNAESALDELIKQDKRAESDKLIEQLTAKLAVFNSALGDLEELRAAESKLKKLRDDYQRAAMRSKSVREKIERAESQLAAAQGELDNCRVPELADIIEGRFKPGILRNEYTSQLVYLGELRESIKGYDDKSPLYAYVREELTDRMNYYKTLISSTCIVSFDVKKELEEVDRLSKLKEKLTAQRDKAKDALAVSEKELAIASGDCEAIKREGEQASERLSAIKKKLESVFGEGVSDYGGEIEKLKGGLSRARRERDEQFQIVDKARKDVQNTQISLSECRTKLVSSEEEIKNTQEEIDKALSEGGYADIAACRAIVAEISAYGDAEAELKAYDEKKIALSSRRDELLLKKGADTVTEEQLNAASARQKELKEQVKERHAEQKVVEARLSESRKKLERKKLIEVELNKKLRRKELVSQLKELVKGNKFLEYIAGEYLSDISKSASAMLLKLTQGRYYLTYTDTFYVADNFNGGKLRGVNTLSGGETFLVSLSLALALSSSICRSSMRSIEFFFLDEGFGTLDESLVDTVMDTLEKLRSSDFTIGIISHVEELKHRIDSKITVNKATETHGSTVTVSV